MKITYPHTIENCIGEKIIFQSVLHEPDGDKVIGENFVQPGCGPVMHNHLLQDESLTVLKGKIGYQVLGEEEKFAGEGETILFKRGTPHRFWNAGNDILHCNAWIKPANSIVYFLTAIYDAQNKSGKAQPDQFDAAFLLTRYAGEYELVGIPPFVKKVILPITYRIGSMLGKYKKFKDAPEPLRR